MITLTTVETDWGWLGLAAGERGIHGLTLTHPTAEAALAAIADEFPRAAPGHLPLADAAAEELRRYFRGERLTFSTPLDLPERPVFWRRVWEIVAAIPYGETLSYGDVARKAGVAKAARAVGGAMAHNPVAIIVPCHRVVGSDGGLGGYGGGLEMKRRLLEMERAGLARNTSAREYRPPRGVNYRCQGETDLIVLSQSLCEIAAFLQDVDPYVELVRHADWWEHDGSHFAEGRLRFRDLFAMVATPRDVFQSMSGDDLVFVGVPAADNAWYLRFYAHWDEDGSMLIGRFDVTVPEGLSERFEGEVVKRLGCEVEKEDSETYYSRVIS